MGGPSFVFCPASSRLPESVRVRVLRVGDHDPHPEHLAMLFREWRAKGALLPYERTLGGPRHLSPARHRAIADERTTPVQSRPRVSAIRYRQPFVFIANSVGVIHGLFSVVPRRAATGKEIETKRHPATPGLLFALGPTGSARNKALPFGCLLKVSLAPFLRKQK